MGQDQVDIAVANQALQPRGSSHGDLQALVDSLRGSQLHQLIDATTAEIIPRAGAEQEPRVRPRHFGGLAPDGESIVFREAAPVYTRG